eukprot:m.10612 g.10612  ORF g.10612 m.10612 type:complete len:1550 (+) comp8413_c0_seq1:251-4900(+)
MMVTDRNTASQLPSSPASRPIGLAYGDAASSYEWSKASGTPNYFNILVARRAEIREQDMGADEGLLMEWMLLMQELDVLSRIGAASEAGKQSKSSKKFGTTNTSPSTTTSTRKSTKRTTTPITPPATPQANIRTTPDRIPITERPRVCIVERRPNESIGLQISSTKQSAVPRVSWVSPEGPSALAGIRAGDVLMQMNGIDCIDKSNAEIAKMIQKGGTELRLLVAAAQSSTKHITSSDNDHRVREHATDVLKTMTPGPQVRTQVSQVTDLNSIFSPATSSPPKTTTTSSNQTQQPGGNRSHDESASIDPAAAVRQLAQGMLKNMAAGTSSVTTSPSSSSSSATTTPSSKSDMSPKTGDHLTTSNYVSPYAPSKKFSSIVKPVETFSVISALSRGSKYVDKPPKQKAFWEKHVEEPDKNAKKKFLRAGSRKDERMREKQDKASNGDNQLERPIKAFINNQRKSGSFGDLNTTFDSTDAEDRVEKVKQQEAPQTQKPQEPQEPDAKLSASARKKNDSVALVQRQRDEARDERDQLVDQLVTLTDNYEELLTSKETLIESLEKTVSKQAKEVKSLEQQKKLYMAKASSATSTHSSEVFKITHQQEKLAKEWNKGVSDNSSLVNENRRIKALLTESTNKVAKLTKELNSVSKIKTSNSSELEELREMVTVMEEALEAKDEVLKMKLLTREDELSQLKKQLRIDLALEQDKIRSSLHKDFEALQDDLRTTKQLHEQEKQAALNTKQAEMDKALKQLQDSIQLSLSSTSTSDSESAILVEQMRSALNEKEIEKQEALDARQRFCDDLVRQKQEEMERALAQKDKELGSALNVAQREVDKLLEGKQMEVDALLDTKDHTITLLSRELDEAKTKVKMTMSVSAKNSGSADLSQALKSLHVLLDTKTSEVHQLEDAIKHARDENEITLRQLEEKHKEDVIAAVEESNSKMASVMEEMQTALFEAMSAKGDLLCLDEKATNLIAKEMGQDSKDKDVFESQQTLARVTDALANTDPTVNKEVIKLKLQIARLLNKDEVAISGLKTLEDSSAQEKIDALREENLSLHNQITGFKAQQKLLTTSNTCDICTVNNKMSSDNTEQNNVTPAKDPEYQAQHQQLVDLQQSKSELELELNAKNTTCTELQLSNDNLEEARVILQEHAWKVETELRTRVEETQALYATRRRLLNEILELKGNARVFCRVRPLLPSETDLEQAQLRLAFSAMGKIGVVDDTGRNVTGSKVSKAYDFEFNGVFDQQVAQEQVFEEVKQLVDCAISGYNVCMFAYGQTGSGKTYTMTGEADPEKEGIIPRTVKHTFNEVRRLEEHGWTFEVSVSFLEIYNETIRDLLVENTTTDADLPRYDIKQGKDGSMFVTNLTHRVVHDHEQLNQLVAHANTNRAVGFSDLNEHSSRSHSICQLVINGENAEAGTTLRTKISMVDLAGSERLMRAEHIIDAAPMDDRTRLREEYALRQKETLNINKSLSNLANVVQAIQTKSQHIPYRNSKLTYFLQDALGGSSKSLMMVNISPREDCLNESLNSLRFAAKVNNTSFGKADRNVFEK